MGKLFDAMMGRDLTLAAEQSPVPGASGSGADIAGVVSPTEWHDREHFAQITAAELFDKYLDLMPVNRDTALSVGAVDRGHQLLTTQVSSFPLVHMTNGQRTEQQPLIVVQPEVGRHRQQTVWWTVDALVFYGRAYWRVVQRRSDGYPSRFEFLHESNVELDTRGRVVKAFGMPQDPDDVIRFDGPHSGILNRPKRIREAIAIDVAAANASANPVPSVDLHQKGGDPLSAEKVELMKAGWIRARKSDGGGVGFSNPNIEVRTLGQHPEQLLIAGRNATALNIARLMNLPAWAVDASVEGTSLTYSNVQGRSRELIDYTLIGYMESIAGRLSMSDILPSTQSVRMDPMRLLASDMKDLATTLATLVDSQIITPEQAQRVLAGTPLERVL